MWDDFRDTVTAVAALAGAIFGFITMIRSTKDRSTTLYVEWLSAYDIGDGWEMRYGALRAAYPLEQSARPVKLSIIRPADAFPLSHDQATKPDGSGNWEPLSYADLQVYSSRSVPLSDWKPGAKSESFPFFLVRRPSSSSKVKIRISLSRIDRRWFPKHKIINSVLKDSAIKVSA